MIILKSDNSVFPTEHSARMVAGRKKLSNYKIIPHEGGYAIEMEENKPVNTNSTTDISALEQPTVVKRHRVTRPWEPATLMGIPEHMKDPAFVYRYCTKEEARPGNIRKKMAEGWEIDTELSKKMKAHNLVPTINDGKPMDSTLQIREMVVMRMPREMKESRDAYFAKLNGENSSGTQENFDNEVNQITGGQSKSYGNVKTGWSPTN